MSLKHRKVITVADDPAAAGKLRPSDWGSTSTNYGTAPTHVFDGGALGALAMRDTGSVDGFSWLPSEAGVLVSDGDDEIPVFRPLLAADIPALPYAPLDLTGAIVDADIVSLAWSKLTDTPTTIAGYGITDFNSLGDARWDALGAAAAVAGDLAAHAALTTTAHGLGASAFHPDAFFAAAAHVHSAADITTGTLAVARGGTGTGTAFTAGSVVFAGAGGAYSEDNANFFYDDATNRLGIGTTNPTGRLHLSGDQSRPAWGTFGVGFRSERNTFTDTTSAGVVANVTCNSFGGGILAASSATTFTDAANLVISGAPVAGANVTIANRWALQVTSDMSAMDGGLSINAGSLSTTRSFAVDRVAGNGARSAEYNFVYGVNSGFQLTANVTNQRDWFLAGSTFTGNAATRTITNYATLYIDGAGTASTNAAITNNYALWVNAGDVRFGGNVAIGATIPGAKVDVLGVAPGISNAVKGLLNVYTNDSQAIDTGGSITLGGNITGTSTARNFAGLVGRKENATSANEAGYLALFTNNGGTLTERIRVTSAGVVGIGTGSPNANALLDLSSTTKAFMPPRMTTTQRDAIASPTAGMVIYNSSTNKLNVYTTAWEAVTSA